MPQKFLRAWPIGLLGTVALLYAWIGFAAVGLDRILGLAGALAILAALVLARRSTLAAVAVLLAGALPLPISTWWSIITPLLAILGLLLARPAIRAAAELA